MVLQKRISLALTAVITIFVTVQGYLAYTSLETQEDLLVDEILQMETRRLIERIRSREILLDPTMQPLRLGPNLQAWLAPSATANTASVASHGESVEPGQAAAMAPTPSHLVGLPDGTHHFDDGERIYHAIIEPLADGRLFVQFDATQNEQFVYDFGRVLLATGSGATLVNQVPRDDVENVDRLALVTVLRNLLRNAVEHASPGACSVRRIANGLTVADEGPGIAAEHRPFVFDRYFQGRLADSPGAARHDKGLGLAIARQTADLRGWRLELDPAGSRGTVFSLRFSR